jgi:hypothetical protein
MVDSRELECVKDRLVSAEDFWSQSDWSQFWSTCLTTHSRIFAFFI